VPFTQFILNLSEVRPDLAAQNGLFLGVQCHLNQSSVLFDSIHADCSTSTLKATKLFLSLIKHRVVEVTLHLFPASNRSNIIRNVVGYSWTVDWRQVPGDNYVSVFPETSVLTLGIVRRPIECLPGAHSSGERLEREDNLKLMPRLGINGAKPPLPHINFFIVHGDSFNLFGDRGGYVIQVASTPHRAVPEGL